MDFTAMVASGVRGWHRTHLPNILGDYARRCEVAVVSATAPRAENYKNPIESHGKAATIIVPIRRAPR